MKQTVLMATLLVGGALMALAPITIQHLLVGSRAAQERLPVWPVPEDETAARKARLVNTLLPAIQQNNRVLIETRARVERLMHQFERGRALNRRDQQWLATLSERYRLDLPEELDTVWFRALLRRVDIIPADLALAQGALESGWGESRFAVEGNNYFGHWCFTPGCGLVPESRPEGATYEVRRFASVEESVRRYMRNLNSHPRYRQLRLARERARQEGRPISGTVMAAGLDGYAQTGEVYVRQIREMISGNRFDQYAND